MKQYYLIDHKHLFFFGYIFYLVVPWYVGISGIFRDFPGMELYYQYFQLIPKEKINTYLFITISWLPAFFLGHYCFKLLVPHKKTLQLFKPSFTSHGVYYIAILLTCLLIIFTYLGRNIIFSGYGIYELNVRGKMNTLLIVFNFFLLYQLITDQKISRLLVVSTIMAVLLSLSMGGRTYVLQTFVVFLVYKTSFAKKRWKIHQIAAVGVLCYLVGSFVGLWRIGISFSLENASYSLLAEPVFTWFSTSTFLTANEIPLINMPWNFITSFVNLVPNTIFSFQDYIISTKAMGYTYENPLGADSVWSTFVINFGALGSFFFIFITGFVLNLLRHLSEKSRFAAVYYIMVCGLLPFQFFRDGFFIVNKQLFFNFLIFPALLIAGLRFLYYVHFSLFMRAERAASSA